MSDCSTIKEIKQSVEDMKASLLHAIENNLVDYDAEDAEETEIDPLAYKVGAGSSQEKFIELLQKVTLSMVDLTGNLEAKARSGMIHAIRAVCDNVTLMYNEGNQVAGNLPEGKGKHKFLEHVSKCKQSAVQLKINISVKASSDASDDTKDLDTKIFGLVDQIAQSFEVVTHSDRVFTDMSLNDQKMKSAASGTTSSSSNWNNINWN